RLAERVADRDMMPAVVEREAGTGAPPVPLGRLVVLRGAGEQEADPRLPLVPVQAEGVVLILLREPGFASPPLADEVGVVALLQLLHPDPCFEGDLVAVGEAEVDPRQVGFADR